MRANPATTHDNAGIAAWRFKLKAEIDSYGDANTFLGGAKERELGPHMIVREHSTPTSWRDYIAVVLYDTEIIRYYPDGTFSVDNGGWNTLTTRARLNAVVPKGFHVWHERKQLCIAGNGTTVRNATHDNRINVPRQES